MLQIVQPDTPLRWHREGFRWFWRMQSSGKPPQQPKQLAADTIKLIRQMARENRQWGAGRIRGELLKLGTRVSKRTIQKYIAKARGEAPGGQNRSTLLATHAKDVWACEFIPVITVLFQTLYAFVIVEHGSRRVVHIGVTAHPTDEWTAEQVRMTGIELIHTSYEEPKASAI